jgi:hypothetical protein
MGGLAPLLVVGPDAPDPSPMSEGTTTPFFFDGGGGGNPAS